MGTLEAVATTEQKKVQKAVTRAAAVYDRQLKMFLKFLKPRSTLVWVQWVLQHPCFLMTWVLAPTLFGKIDTLSQQYLEIKAWQHFVLSISTHGFKFLTWALQKNAF